MKITEELARIKIPTPATLNWPGKSSLGEYQIDKRALANVRIRLGSEKKLLNGCTLIEGDNLAVMLRYRSKLRGKLKLVYIDPPFNAAHSFFTSASINGKGRTKKRLAYTDTWSKDGATYLQFLWPRLQLIHELLSDDGSLYVHCDYRASAHIRLILEEIFGSENYINECIWSYKTGGNSKKLGFARKHDTIHFVTKNRSKAFWNRLSERSYLKHRYGFKNITLGEDDNGTYNLVSMRDVWDIPALRGNQPERENYPTQKPEKLLERIISASSQKGDLVADLFCGSGTTGVVAKKMGRNVLLVDKGKVAIKVSRTRLQELAGSED